MGKFRVVGGIEGRYMKVNHTLPYVVFWSYFSNSCFSGVGWDGWDGMEGSFVFPARMGDNVMSVTRRDIPLSYGGLDYYMMILPCTSAVYAPIPAAPPACS